MYLLNTHTIAQERCTEEGKMGSGSKVAKLMHVVVGGASLVAGGPAGLATYLATFAPCVEVAGKMIDADEKVEKKRREKEKND